MKGELGVDIKLRAAADHIDTTPQETLSQTKRGGQFHHRGLPEPSASWSLVLHSSNRRRPGALTLQVSFGDSREVTSIFLTNVLERFPQSPLRKPKLRCIDLMPSMAPAKSADRGGHYIMASWKVIQIGKHHEGMFQKSIRAFQITRPTLPGRCQAPPDHWPGLSQEGQASAKGL